MKSFRLNRRIYKNKIVFYASFPAADGWSKRKSTNCNTRTKAEQWCIRQLKNGMATGMANGDSTLREWCSGFWGAGGRYDKERQARGYTLSRIYLENQKRSLETHILPVFGDTRLYDLKTVKLDSFFLNLYKKSKLSGSTINNIMKSIRAPLHVAVKLGCLDKSPMQAVSQVNKGDCCRGALTQEELDKLFADNSLDTVWDGDRVSILLSMLAAGCGVRHGEALAVRPMDLQDDIFLVARQWDQGSREFKSPKGKRTREVPIPPRLKDELKSYITDNKILADGLLFACRMKNDRETIPALRSALAKIGISFEEQGREKRFLDFHSLRHTYVTRLRAEGTPDWKIQAVAGHRSVEMTDTYTHAKGEDFREIADKKIIPFKKGA